jgi:small subunit ribosomal protein S16
MGRSCLHLQQIVLPHDDSMPVRLRLSLHGNRNNRIFHLVATDLRKRRDGKPIELLGVYDPRLRPGQEHKTIHWSVDRIMYWLNKGGALPSKPVVKLLERVRSFLFFFFTCHLTCYTGRHYSPKLEIPPKVTTRSRGPFERANQRLPFIRAAFTFMRGLIFPFLHNYVKFVRRVARFSVHVGTQNLYVLYASPNQSHIIHLSYKSIRCSCMLE